MSAGNEDLSVDRLWRVPWLDVRLLVIAPGQERPYDGAEWRDALVVVEGGEVTLESCSGSALTLRRGAVLCLAGLSLRALRNAGAEPALLASVSRKRAKG